MQVGLIGRSRGLLSLWAGDMELIRWGVRIDRLDTWLLDCKDDAYFSGNLGLARLAALEEIEPKLRTLLIELLPEPIAYKARRLFRLHSLAFSF